MALPKIYSNISLLLFTFAICTRALFGQELASGGRTMQQPLAELLRAKRASETTICVQIKPSSPSDEPYILCKGAGFMPAATAAAAAAASADNIAPYDYAAYRPPQSSPYTIPDKMAAQAYATYHPQQMQQQFKPEQSSWYATPVKNTAEDYGKYNPQQVQQQTQQHQPSQFSPGKSTPEDYAKYNSQQTQQYQPSQFSPSKNTPEDYAKYNPQQVPHQPPQYQPSQIPLYGTPGKNKAEDYVKYNPQQIPQAPQQIPQLPQQYKPNQISLHSTPIKNTAENYSKYDPQQLQQLPKQYQPSQMSSYGPPSKNKAEDYVKYNPQQIPQSTQQTPQLPQQYKPTQNTLYAASDNNAAKSNPQQTYPTQTYSQKPSFFSQLPQTSQHQSPPFFLPQQQFLPQIELPVYEYAQSPRPQQQPSPAFPTQFTANFDTQNKVLQTSNLPNYQLNRFGNFGLSTAAPKSTDISNFGKPATTANAASEYARPVTASSTAPNKPVATVIPTLTSDKNDALLASTYAQPIGNSRYSANIDENVMSEPNWDFTNEEFKMLLNGISRNPIPLTPSAVARTQQQPQIELSENCNNPANALLSANYEQQPVAPAYPTYQSPMANSQDQNACSLTAPGVSPMDVMPVFIAVPCYNQQMCQHSAAAMQPTAYSDYNAARPTPNFLGMMPNLFATTQQPAQQAQPAANLGFAPPFLPRLFNPFYPLPRLNNPFAPFGGLLGAAGNQNVITTTATPFARINNPTVGLLGAAPSKTAEQPNELSSEQLAADEDELFVTAEKLSTEPTKVKNSSTTATTMRTTTTDNAKESNEHNDMAKQTTKNLESASREKFQSILAAAKALSAGAVQSETERMRKRQPYKQANSNGSNRKRYMQQLQSKASNTFRK